MFDDETLHVFGKSLIGQKIKSRGRKEKLTIKSYTLGTRRNGVWITFENEAFTRYMEYKTK